MEKKVEILYNLWWEARFGTDKYNKLEKETDTLITRLQEFPQDLAKILEEITGKKYEIVKGAKVYITKGKERLPVGRVYRIIEKDVGKERGTLTLYADMGVRDGKYYCNLTITGQMRVDGEKAGKIGEEIENYLRKLNIKRYRAYGRTGPEAWVEEEVAVAPMVVVKITEPGE